MSCENCEYEKKQELLSDQFGEDLAELLEKYRGELNAIEISHGLILEAKIEMCCSFPCYNHMLGIMTGMLTHDIRKMWEEMKPTEEEENAPNTL